VGEFRAKNGGQIVRAERVPNSHNVNEMESTQRLLSRNPVRMRNPPVGDPSRQFIARKGGHRGPQPEFGLHPLHRISRVRIPDILGAKVDSAENRRK